MNRSGLLNNFGVNIEGQNLSQTYQLCSLTWSVHGNFETSEARADFHEFDTVITSCGTAACAACAECAVHHDFSAVSADSHEFI